MILLILACLTIDANTSAPRFQTPEEQGIFTKPGTDSVVFIAANSCVINADVNTTQEEYVEDLKWCAGWPVGRMPTEDEILAQSIPTILP